MKKPKILLVGLGRWGSNWARVLHKKQVLAGIVDTDKNKNKQKIKGVPFFPKITRKLLSQIDAAVIATPAETHFSIAQRLLRAGKATLVEKPLALTTSQGQKLVDLAKMKNAVLMTGHLLDYHPAFLKIHACIKEKLLGNLQYITSNRLNLGTIRSRENVLWSFAPHDIGVALRLTGQFPTSVSCQGGAYTQKGLADISLMQIKFRNGVQAFIHVNWLHPFKEQRLVVVGSKGMLSFCDLDKKLYFYPSKVLWTQGRAKLQKNRRIRLRFSSKSPLENQGESLIEALQKGRPGPADGVAGLAVLKVLEAGQNSMKNNGAEMRLKNKKRETLLK